ncbi:MAG TPA: SDR family oxidoreductase [Anaerohalosphaeraceae bacterium]|nr:SDR family oxidoreductase [Anaerohalosphaeraceae bacterium]
MQNEATERPKRVLITGCSSGFGLLTAVEAAREGFDVVATMRKLDKAGPLLQALEKSNLTVKIERLDITDPASIETIVQQFSPIDILINNAGILIAGSFLDLTEQECDKIFQTNYFGPVRLTRAVVPQMIQRKSGRIVNIASLAGLIGHPFNSAYAASKHALIGFTQSIRVELAPFGIDVVSVEPGYHKTEIIGANANQAEHFYDRTSPMFEWNRGFLKAMFEEILPRAGDPQQVADLIVRIISCEKPKAHYIIGKDAAFAMTFKSLGLWGWLERQIIRKIRKYRRLENQREEEKRNRRKQSASIRK